MKFFKTIQVFAVSIAVFASCQQQLPETSGKDAISVNELVPVTFSASIVQTKVAYEETAQKNLQPDWEKDDVVIGFDENGDPYEFTVSKVEADGSATLTGNAPANCTLHLVFLGGITPASTERLSLPYQISYDGQAGDKTIPAVMFADGNIVFGSGDFHFHNAGAVIGINATKGVPDGSTISKITVYGDNLSAATIALAGNNLTLTAGGSTGESISTGDGFSATVSSDGNGTLTVKPVLIAVPAGATVSKISVVVGSDSYIYTLQSPVTLDKNEYRYVQNKTFKSDRIPGTLSGLFTVADPDGIPDSGDERKVRFSQGNLYYDGSGFKFESNQYDYRTAAGYNSCIGGSISSNGTPSGNWGFFGWSTSTTNYGMSTSKNPADYSGDFVDWGQNAINESPANTWSTLSSEEWTYLIGHHAYKAVTVNGVAGMCLAPDGVLGDAIEDSYADDAAWKAAENAGIVFLPAFGLRTGSDIVFDNTGHYWTSTPDPDVVMKNNYVYYVSFAYGGISGTSSITRDYGNAVRLVMDATPEPAPIEYVDLGLSVEWATCNLGATKPEEYGEYFAWGDTEGYKPTGNTFSHSFNWTNAPFNNGSISFNSEYFNSVRNTVCPDNVLASDYDAAHVIMGGTWRLPKFYDFEELLNNTNNSWTNNYNDTGVSGYVFTSKTDSSKSIFLPAGNRADGTALNYLNENGCYWLAEQDMQDSFAWYISFSNGYASKSMDEHRYGMPIRPVRPKE